MNTDLNYALAQERIDDLHRAGDANDASPPPEPPNAETVR